MSLMKKGNQSMDKVFWVIAIGAAVITAPIAIFLPIPRKFKWLLFFVLWLALAFAGIMIYSKTKKK